LTTLVVPFSGIVGAFIIGFLLFNHRKQLKLNPTQEIEHPQLKDPLNSKEKSSNFSNNQAEE
jgi:hypothetical protein